MTEHRSLRDTALDLLVYAPIGAAVTVGGWLPKLSARGRERFGDQAKLARVVGQLAVGEGRRRAIQAGQRLVEPAAPDDGGADRLEPGAPGPGPVPAPEATLPEATLPEATVHELRPRQAAPERQARLPATSLAIPDYESLSASQVVARLAGLSPAELEEVRLHETATRARRTVLARIDQLRHGV